MHKYRADSTAMITARYGADNELTRQFDAAVTMRSFRSIWDASLADNEWMLRIDCSGPV